MRMPDFTPCCPGLTSSLHLESSERRALFRKRSVPSRRASLHLGPRYLAIVAIQKFARSSAPTACSVPPVFTPVLNPPAFGRPATVVRDRRHVGNARDL